MYFNGKIIKENYNFSRIKYPAILEFNCSHLKYLNNSKKIIISGSPENKDIINITTNKKIIPYQFIIRRIISENNDNKRKIIIIGKLVDNLENTNYNFLIHFFYPNITLRCYLKPYSKNVLSKICCINKIDINTSEFLMENQIVQLSNVGKTLLLINEQTLIKLKFIKKNGKFFQEIFEHSELRKKSKNHLFLILINILIILLLRKIKFNLNIKLS